MILVANVLVALIALIHLYFLVLEMFLWQTPFGMKTFGTTQRQIAAGHSFDEQDHDVAAVENWDRQQIHDPELQRDHRHQREPDRVASFTRG